MMYSLSCLVVCYIVVLNYEVPGSKASSLSDIIRRNEALYKKYGMNLPAIMARSHEYIEEYRDAKLLDSKVNTATPPTLHHTTTKQENFTKISNKTTTDKIISTTEQHNTKFVESNDEINSNESKLISTSTESMKTNYNKPMEDLLKESIIARTKTVSMNNTTEYDYNDYDENETDANIDLLNETTSADTSNEYFKTTTNTVDDSDFRIDLFNTATSVETTKEAMKTTIADKDYNDDLSIDILNESTLGNQPIEMYNADKIVHVYKHENCTESNAKNDYTNSPRYYTNKYTKKLGSVTEKYKEINLLDLEFGKKIKPDRKNARSERYLISTTEASTTTAHTTSSDGITKLVAQTQDLISTDDLLYINGAADYDYTSDDDIIKTTTKISTDKPKIETITKSNLNDDNSYTKQDEYRLATPIVVHESTAKDVKTQIKDNLASTVVPYLTEGYILKEIIKDGDRFKYDFTTASPVLKRVSHQFLTPITVGLRLLHNDTETNNKIGDHDTSDSKQINIQKNYPKQHETTIVEIQKSIPIELGEINDFPLFSEGRNPFKNIDAQRNYDIYHQNNDRTKHRIASDPVDEQETSANTYKIKSANIYNEPKSNERNEYISYEPGSYSEKIIQPIIIEKEVPVTKFVDRFIEKKVPYPERVEIVKEVPVEKPVPVPVPYEKIVEKPVEVTKYVDRHHKVEVPVPHPIPFEIPVPVEKQVFIEKKVPVPVEVEKYVEKKVYQKVPVPTPIAVPYEVRVPVEQPFLYPITIDKPFPVPYAVEKRVPVEKIIERKVPFPVEKQVPIPVHIETKVPVPYAVETKVPYPVEKIVEKPVRVTQYVEKKVPVNVPVPHPYPVHVPQPYPVERYIERKVPVPYEVEKIVEKRVPVPVSVPYPVEKIVEKIIEKPVTVTKYVDKPYPVETKVPVPVPYEKIVERKVPYPVPVKVPYEVRVPVPYEKLVEKPVPYPVRMPQDDKHIQYSHTIPMRIPFNFQQKLADNQPNSINSQLPPLNYPKTDQMPNYQRAEQMYQQHQQQMNQKPEQFYMSQVYQKPEQMFQKPEQFYMAQVYQKPEQMYQKPEQFYMSQVYQKPEQMYQKPEQLYQKQEEMYQNHHLGSPSNGEHMKNRDISQIYGKDNVKSTQWGNLYASSYQYTTPNRHNSFKRSQNYSRYMNYLTNNYDLQQNRTVEPLYKDIMLGKPHNIYYMLPYNFAQLGLLNYKLRRNDREPKNLNIEYGGFRPTMVPSIEVDLDGIPVDHNKKQE